MRDKDKVLSISFDSDQKMSGVLITGPRNLSPCIAGVRIGDSKDEAIMSLDTNGLTRDEDIGQHLSYITADGKISILLEWSPGSQKIVKVECESYIDMSNEDGNQITEDNEEYILPESDKRQILETEIADFTDEQRQLAINEIYARHGRLFDNQDIQDYFEQRPWYKGTIEPAEFDEAILNDYEKNNIKLLERTEKTDEISEESSLNFIGTPGEYQAGSDLESGLITIFSIDYNAGIAYFEIGTQELPGVLRQIEGTIVDDNTVIGGWGNATFTLRWSDAGCFTITRDGNCDDGLGMDEVTNNVEYVSLSCLR